jgi:hypothetical protein
VASRRSVAYRECTEAAATRALTQASVPALRVPAQAHLHTTRVVPAGTVEELQNTVDGWLAGVARVALLRRVRKQLESVRWPGRCCRKGFQKQLNGRLKGMRQA